MRRIGGTILHLQCVRWANSYRRPIHRIGWLWNASWDIWRAFWTLNYASEARILSWENFTMQNGHEMQMTSDPSWDMWFLLALNHFVEMQETTNHCIVYGMVTNHCTKEDVCLRQLLADVRYVQKGTTSIMCDNQGCITLAKNLIHHSPYNIISLERN